MASHTPPNQRDIFQSNARKAVMARDTETGAIPASATLIHPYRQLDEADQLAMRLWLDQEMQAAMARLDAPAARAWLAIKDRIASAV